MDYILVILAILVILLMWKAVYDSNSFTVSNYAISDNKLLKAAKLVVISDLHGCSFGHNNIRLKNAIDEIKPDLILIAGDMINGNHGDGHDIAIDLVKSLAEKYPVYYGNGNHETRLKESQKKLNNTCADDYFKEIQESGAVLLDNKSVELSEYGINIIGSEIDASFYKRFGIKPMTNEEFSEGVDKPADNMFNILLAHNPDYFERYVAYGAELVFSGHVHGGIVRMPIINKGILSPNVSFFPKYDFGMYTEGRVSMVVSRGLGLHTIPFRLFNPGDLVVVNLEPDKDAVI